MNDDNAKFLKKKMTGGSIDVHPTEKALVVNYEVEAMILSEIGAPVLGEKKGCQKVIKVTSLDMDTDIKQMAREIVEKYEIIHHSKLSEVEQLLYYLQKRKDISSALKMTSSQSEKTKKKNFLPIEDYGGDEVKETANINDLEMYLEMMYDDTEEKLRGTALILQLARNSENLDELRQNEILLGALARVLMEEWKENTQLATNIIYIFFCFSSYTQLHSVVAHFQIGSLCMRIIEQEIKKFDAWKEKKGLSKEDGAKKSKSSKQLQQFASKQEQLLRVAFYLLMNIAEDTKVEAKMHKKGIVNLLLHILDRHHNSQLIFLAVSFLKKLSIMTENKDLMAAENIVSRLQRVLESSQSHDLTNITLRLLLNLSFDTDLRRQMTQSELLERVCSVITGKTKEDDKLVATCLLYHISMEHQTRPSISSTVPTLVKNILSATRENPQVEALALLVNLSNDSSCASLMAHHRTINNLFKVAFTTRDPLVCKVLKNILKHPHLNHTDANKETHKHTDTNKETHKQTDNKGVKKHHKAFLNHVGELADEVKDAFRDDFSAECLGMLAHLPDVDYSVLLHEYSLVDWITQKLEALVAMSNRDVHDQQLTAELVLLIRAACMDESSALLLYSPPLIANLINVLKLKQEDDYMVLLIVSIFHHLLQHPPIRDSIVNNTEVPAYLIDLIHDNNVHVRKLCATSLEVVGEVDGEWSNRVQSEKFRCHNQHWLEMVQQHDKQCYDHHLLALHHKQQQQLDQHSALLLSRQYYHDQLAASNHIGSSDSFVGGFVEDAAALDHTDFYYGDPGYHQPSSELDFESAYNLMSGHLDDYDPDLLLNSLRGY